MLERFFTRQLERAHFGVDRQQAFLQTDCTADKLAAGLVPLLSDTPERRRQLDAFARLDTVMDIANEPPSIRAAKAVLDTIRRHKAALPSPAGSC